MQCACDAVGCAYHVGFQVVLLALNMLNEWNFHSPACRDLGYLKIGVSHYKHMGTCKKLGVCYKLSYPKLIDVNNITYQIYRVMFP